MTTTITFRVNGAIAAVEQFTAKTQALLDRAAGHYKSQTEFTIRATLKLSGADRATIDICEGAHEIQYPWITSEGAYGILREGKILHW